MNFTPITINAATIPDAWFQCIYSLLDNGYKYEIQHGSYIGETRLQFDFITIVIKHPYAEPYDLMLPEIPSHLNIPNPVESGYIEQYLPYLMTDAKNEKEDYTYGQRLTACSLDYEKGCMDWEVYGNQIEYWISILKNSSNTNQAVLQVAQPSDYTLNDPPCLHAIGLQIKDNSLIFYPMFRSWDLWGGMPANLAGIAVLQKYMADEMGVESGPMCASSKGLHIYGYVEELAKLRANKKD